ncbi:hypothetical protein B0H10DRAFT_2229659 [Mycena sp. CBHHK59/15]|nr:hypothetical protein B0H10DRAFT_2229659 [Mycena sp. CBHHK59/15]
MFTTETSLSLATKTSSAATSKSSKWYRPHSHEYERLVGVLGMVFHKTELHAQIRADAIDFSTRQVGDAGGSPEKPGVVGSVRSSATALGNKSPKFSTDALNPEDDVLIYDAREGILDLNRDIDNLENVLPRYEDFHGEIPAASCALVGHTVTQFKGLQQKRKVDKVGFNIHWVVVLGEPA